MSFLDSIFSFFKKILDFIKEYFWIILAVVIVVLAVFFPGVLTLCWTWLSTIGMPTLGAWAAAVAGFFAGLGLPGTIAAVVGISFLLDPEGTSDAVGGIIESVGSASGNILTDILSSPGGMLLAGVGLYMLFFSGNGDDATTKLELSGNPDDFYGSSDDDGYSSSEDDHQSTLTLSAPAYSVSGPTNDPQDLTVSSGSYSLSNDDSEYDSPSPIWSSGYSTSMGGSLASEGAGKVYYSTNY